MRFIVLAFSLAIATLTVASKTYAQESSSSGVLIFPSLLYHTESGGFAPQHNMLYTDLRLGYLTSFGLYFGVTYSSITGSGPNGYMFEQLGLGNSLGYFYGPFGIVATAYLSAHQTELLGLTRSTRTEGTGFQADLSLLMPVTTWLRVGPVFTYRTMNYTSSKDENGVSNNGDTSHTEFIPTLGLSILF